MIFLAPWFLLGLSAAVIPLVLHLRRAQRRNKIVFSTTAFFDEQFLRTARRARVQDILLMLMRMALLALLALALAQPLLRLPWLASMLAPLGGKQTVAIVIDDSASMGLIENKGMLLDRAKAAALQVVDELAATRGDKATVILAGKRDAGPRILFDPPTTDLAQVKQAIRDVELTDLGTDIASAAATAGQTLGEGSETKNVYIFSDFAASALPEGAGLSAGPLAALFLVSSRPTQTNPANISIDAIQYGAPRPMLGVPFTFRVLASNSALVAKKIGLNLVVDDQIVAHRELEIGPSRSAVTRFVHRFAVAGWHRGRIEVDPAQPDAADAIPADNRRYFALAVEDRLKVLAVNGAPSEISASDELLFFRAAMLVRPLDQTSDLGRDYVSADKTVALKEITPPLLSRAKLADYNLIVLANVADLPPPSVEALEHYVDAGGSLFITLGDRVDPAAYNKWTGAGRLHGGILPGKLLAKLDDAKTAGFVAWADESHPATAGFSASSRGSLSDVKFTARYKLDAAHGDSGGGGDILMQSDAGDALLVEKRFGSGRVVLFTSTLDRDWTNLPLEPVFVPWIYRLVGYLAQPQVGSAGFFAAGQSVKLPASVTQQKNPRVTTPAGNILYPTLESGPAGPSLLFTQTEHAGVYTVTEGAAPATGEANAAPAYALAVNIPADESQTIYATEEYFKPLMDPAVNWAWVDDTASVVSTARLARQGLSIWDALLLIALVAALVEPWLANRLAKLRGGEAATVAVGPPSMVVERATRPSEAA